MSVSAWRLALAHARASEEKYAPNFERLDAINDSSYNGIKQTTNPNCPYSIF